MKSQLALILCTSCFVVGCHNKKSINISDSCSINYIVDGENENSKAIEITNDETFVRLWFKDDELSFSIERGNKAHQGILYGDSYSILVKNSDDDYSVINKSEELFAIDSVYADGYRAVIEYFVKEKQINHFDFIENIGTKYSVDKDGLHIAD